MGKQSKDLYEFGPFRLDPTEQRLLRDGQLVPLETKPFQTLLVLVESSGHLIEKDELMKRIWPDQFIEEGNLTRNISVLRKALGESRSEQQYIETVPRRGYRFVAQVRKLHEESMNGAAQVNAPTPVVIESGNAGDLRAETGDEREQMLEQAEVSGSIPGRSVAPELAMSIFKGRWLWPVTLLAASLVVIGFVYALRFRATSFAPGGSPEIRSLAVLPLENLSGDPAQEYFADGMTEALISDLAQVRALRVVSRTSVMRYKGSRKSMQEIAQELNVDAVIEGSVQRAGNRVKIAAQLIHAPTDRHLWARNYEREMADILKLQSEVARAVADEVRIQVTEEERARLAAARRVKPEAYEAYLLGRYHLQRQNEEDLKLSTGHFERAIQLDANYASAWAGLSSAWQQRGIWGAKPFREVEQPARNAALKAIALDEGLAEAHTSSAHLKYKFDWDWVGAEQEFKRAFELDPSSVEAHELFAMMLMALGRLAEAISEIQTAERLDPLSSRVQSQYGRVLYRARNHEEAERHLKRAIELDPRNRSAYGRLADVYEQMGRYMDALAMLEKAEVLGSGSVSAAKRARVYARMGRRDEALRILKDLQRTTEAERISLEFAAAYAALGDKDEAFRLLFSAVEERSQLTIYLKEDPPFDSLHSDPRLKALLRRMNFPEK